MLPELIGPQGGMLMLGLIVVVLYCQLMGWLKIAINPMTMLFLTTSTIPAVQANVNFLDLFYGLCLGSVYFCGLILLAKKLMKSPH